MALTLFDKDMNIIVLLPDEPNDVGGLGADELKAKFDEGGLALKRYINNVLIPEIEASIDAAAQGVPSSGGINGTIIINGSLTTPKYALGSVTEPVIGDEAVTTPKIATRAVTGNTVALRTIGRENLTEEAIMLQSDDFPSNVLPVRAIPYNSLITEKYADGSLTTPKYADGSVTAAKLADDAKTLVFEVTLQAANWTDNRQTVSNEYFKAEGFAYDVAPAPATYVEYIEAGTRADDISADGEVTFICEDVPEVDLTVYVGRRAAV